MIIESIDNRLRILNKLMLELYSRTDVSQDAFYRILGARNALISLKERLVRESPEHR